MSPSAPDHADVVIVGAGIIGLSVGFHLLQADPTQRVVIVEQAERPGSGSTAKATGGIRHQFAMPVLVRLSLHSMPEYRRQIAVLGEIDLGRSPVPFTMHADSGWYLHRLADGALLIGGIDHDIRPGREEAVDPELTVRLIELGVRLIPSLTDASLADRFLDGTQ